MDQGVSKRLRACIVGHSFVRRLGDSLEDEARRDGTDACLGVAAPGLLKVDDVYNEVWTLGRSGYTLHGIRNDIFTTGNLFPDVVILNCGSNDLCDRFVDIESIADGLVSYAHLLTVSFGVKVVYILGVVWRDRCRQVSAAVFRSRARRLNRAVWKCKMDYSLWNPSECSTVRRIRAGFGPTAHWIKSSVNAASGRYWPGSGAKCGAHSDVIYVLLTCHMF